MQQLNLNRHNKGHSIKRRQRGASLLEVISYLGVAAVVVIGAVSLLSQAFGSANANRALEEITAIRTNVKKIYMGQQAGYGTGSMNATLGTMNAFPSTLTVSGSTVTNSWNGGVVVTGATSSFTIRYDAVPKDVCASIVSAQGSTGFISVAVNGGGALTPPITPSAAGTACNTTSNSVVWTAN